MQKTTNFWKQKKNEITTYAVLTTTWAYNNKSLILFIYFNSALPTSIVLVFCLNSWSLMLNFKWLFPCHCRRDWQNVLLSEALKRNWWFPFRTRRQIWRYQKKFYCKNTIIRTCNYNNFTVISSVVYFQFSICCAAWWGKSPANSRENVFC